MGKDMIKLIAEVNHAKDAVIRKAGLLRDLRRSPSADGHDIEALTVDLDRAVDALRDAKKAAGL